MGFLLIMLLLPAIFIAASINTLRTRRANANVPKFLIKEHWLFAPIYFLPTMGVGLLFIDLPKDSGAVPFIALAILACLLYQTVGCLFLFAMFGEKDSTNVGWMLTGAWGGALTGFLSAIVAGHV